MKKQTLLFAMAAILLCVAMIFCSCGTTVQTDGRSQRDTAKKIADGETLKIGIIQYLSHPSLDNCYTGVMQALEASGLKYTVDLQTGSNTSPDSDCATFAKNMVAANYDMIIAIATPAAQAAYAAAADTDIPVIFCAVSDPEGAKLVESNAEPGDLCTGTSDVLDLEAQVDLIQAMQPDVKTIGVLYTSSEANSLTNLANFKAICAARGLTLEAMAVQNAADIPSAAATLCAKVDCVNNFTDNNVVNNLSVLLAAANSNNIPVYGSEEEQVKNGCLASVSIDYVALGVTTGNMAVNVLKGTDIKTMAVATISDATPVVNSDVLAALGMTLPESYADTVTYVTTNAD